MRKIYVSIGLVKRETTRRFSIDGKIQPRVKSHGKKIKNNR